MAELRNPYGLEQRVQLQLNSVDVDLDKAVQLVAESNDKMVKCIQKQTFEILPLVVQLNQGTSREQEKTLRDSLDDSLSSLNRLLIDHESVLSQTAELSNNSKDLVANGYSIIEEHNQNYRNKVAIIVENVTLTLNQKFATLTGFFVKSMTALKDVWLSTKTTTKSNGCCFKTVPERDPPIWLHYLGYFYVRDLGYYPVGWPDELHVTLVSFLRKVLRYVAYYRETFDLERIEDEIQRIEDLYDGFQAISSVIERSWMQERRNLLEEIKEMYRNPDEDAVILQTMERIVRELPCFIKGKEKAPLIYCHEHVKTLVSDVKAYVGSEIGVRACTEHMNEIRRAGLVVSQFECIEKKTLSTDEPVYFLRIDTSM